MEQSKSYLVLILQQIHTLFDTSNDNLTLLLENVAQIISIDMRVGTMRVKTRVRWGGCFLHSELESPAYVLKLC